MTRTSPVRLLKFLPVLLVFFLFASCSSSSGVDNYFTFNYSPGTIFIVFSTDGVEQNQSTLTSLAPDSSILASQGTTRPLVKSVKLTKLSFKPADTGQSYSLSDFDTINISISSDSLPDLLVGSYSGSTDSVFLTNVDFASYLKKPTQHFSINYQINKAPSTDEPIILNYTLVYTAQPQ